MASAKPGKRKVGRPRKKRTALQGGSKIEVERLQLVEQMMAACCTRRDIVRKVMEKFGACEKTAYSYYERVEREWHEEELPYRSYQKTMAVKQLEQILKGATADRKWGAAVRAIEARARILGLNEPDKIVVNTPEAHPTDSMTSAQLRAYMREEQEKVDMLTAQVRAEKAPSVH